MFRKNRRSSMFLPCVAFSLLVAIVNLSGPLLSSSEYKTGNLVRGIFSGPFLYKLRSSSKYERRNVDKSGGVSNDNVKTKDSMGALGPLLDMLRSSSKYKTGNMDKSGGDYHDKVKTKHSMGAFGPLLNMLRSSKKYTTGSVDKRGGYYNDNVCIKDTLEALL